MWCSHCQSEVRPVISLAGGVPRCSLCGNRFSDDGFPGKSSPAFSQGLPSEAIGSQIPLTPHELLARWAREETLPPLELAAGSPPSRPATTPPIARMDGSHPTGPMPVSLPEQISAAPTPTPMAAPHFAPSKVSPPPAQPTFSAEPTPDWETQSQFRDRDAEGPGRFSSRPEIQVHQAHSPVRPPHFPWEPVPAPQSSSRWAMTAPLFVLLGVLGLACGTLLLIYTHFWAAEKDSLLPLGYVIAACSQLVLLLGVVQHVSLGLEQAEQTMSWRVSRLGERLQRVEAASGRPGGNDTAS